MKTTTGIAIKQSTKTTNLSGEKGDETSRGVASSTVKSIEKKIEGSTTKNDDDKNLTGGTVITNFDDNTKKKEDGKKKNLDSIEEIEDTTANPIKIGNNQSGGSNANKDIKDLPPNAQKDPGTKTGKDIPKADGKKTNDPTSKNANPVSNNPNDKPTDGEPEENPFNKLLELSDIIEIDSEFESSMKEIKNILLRYLTDMKIWYKIYTNKEYYGENLEQIRKEAKEQQQPEEILNPDFYNINADIGFAMEIKDLWRFIRDSNILSADFTLANFNRLYMKGEKNYMELFMCPDEVNGKSGYYDYLYAMIQKSIWPSFLQ